MKFPLKLHNYNLPVFLACTVLAIFYTAYIFDVLDHLIIKILIFGFTSIITVLVIIVLIKNNVKKKPS